MNRRYRSDQSKLLLRADQAERQLRELETQVEWLRTELSRSRADVTRLELIEVKLTHEKIGLGRQLTEQKYLLDLLQGREERHPATVLWEVGYR